LNHKKLQPGAMRVLLSISAQGQCAIVPKTPVRGNKSCGSIGMRIRHSKSDALRCCVSSEVFQLADAPVAAAVSTVLKPVLTIGSVLMIVRIVMTWYPEINENEFPWSIAYKPTGWFCLFVPSSTHRFEF
jgi:hypothetical protein